MHALANIHLWRDERASDGHVTIFIIYEKFSDVMEFAENNLDLVKLPKPDYKGFAAAASHNKEQN